MASHYEIVDGCVEVRGYTELFEKRDATDTTDAVGVKICPSSGMTYTADQLKDLLDFTGDDAKCVDCEGVELVDAEDRSGDKQPADDPDIS